MSRIAAHGLTGFTVTASGQTLELTTTAKNASSNNTTVSGYSKNSDVTQPTAGTPGVAGTGFFSPTKYLSGGTNQIGSPNSPDPDAIYVPGTKASLTVNVAGVSADTGITLSGYGSARIKFVAGSDGFNTSGNPITVGINGSGTITAAGMNITYSGGALTFTSTSVGTGGNNYRISDGISGTTGSAGGTTEGFTAYSGSVDTTEQEQMAQLPLIPSACPAYLIRRA